MPILGLVIIFTCIYLMDRTNKFYRNFKNEFLRLNREYLHLQFLKSCKNAAVIPKFLSTRTRRVSASHESLRFEFENKCLTAVIREKYSRIANTKKKVFDNYSLLKAQVSAAVLDECVRIVFYFNDRQERLMTSTHVKKFHALVDKKKSHFGGTPRSFDYLNLSSRSFSPFEDMILKKGSKFITKQPLRADMIVPELEAIVKEVKADFKEETRNFLFFEYRRALNKQPWNILYEYRTIKAMRNDPSICFLMTDKTNKLAVIDTTDYKAKMQACISSLKCKVINKNPLNSLITKVHQLISFNEWPPDMKQVMKENKTGIIPLIFGRLKDHKANCPLRPIVPKTQAPTYFVEKAYVILLKQLLPPSPYVVKSTVDFVNRLKNFALPPVFMMATMDVCQLYPSIDTDFVRNEISNCITASNLFDQNVKVSLLKGLNLILSSNYFCFDGVFYQQTQGAPMGSPVSGFLAEFVMGPIDIAANTVPTLRPCFWTRFVDDIFLLWEHHEDDFKDFCSFMNSLNNNIKFTNQMQVDNKIPFLDVLLENKGNTILRSIYRKPAAQICTIVNTSLSPRNYKISAYSAYVIRAIRVCSATKREEEFEKIKTIAIENGFSTKLVDDLIHRHSSNKVAKVNEESKKISMRYIPIFFEKIRSYLKRHKITLIAKTFPKLAPLLCKKIDSVPMMERCGVYEIPYLDSKGQMLYYIGLTSRKLRVRLAEHINDIKNAKSTTALARKNLSENIQISFNRAKIIAPYDTFAKSVIRESIAILKRKDVVCNDQVSYKIPTLWLSLLK